LLAEVVARLPREPIEITGDLLVRRRRGVVLRELKFEVALRWGSRPATAVYTILDAFGNELEQLRVTRAADGRPRFSYAAGRPLAETNAPVLSQPIQQTDISWLDLTLSFLWWKGGSLTGTERVRGRDCWVVTVPAPGRRDGAEGALESRYSGVVLWIDRQMRMLLQAEAYDRGGELVRRFWIKSFKKVGDTWMVKDMEVEAAPPVQRTKLIVREVAAQKKEP
jgi:hypothetical protein